MDLKEIWKKYVNTSYVTFNTNYNKTDIKKNYKNPKVSLNKTGFKLYLKLMIKKSILYKSN